MSGSNPRASISNIACCQIYNSDLKQLSSKISERPSNWNYTLDVLKNNETCRVEIKCNSLPLESFFDIEKKLKMIFTFLKQVNKTHTLFSNFRRCLAQLIINISHLAASSLPRQTLRTLTYRRLRKASSSTKEDANCRTLSLPRALNRKPMYFARAITVKNISYPCEHTANRIQDFKSKYAHHYAYYH